MKVDVGGSGARKRGAGGVMERRQRGRSAGIGRAGRDEAGPSAAAAAQPPAPTHHLGQLGGVERLGGNLDHGLRGEGQRLHDVNLLIQELRHDGGGLGDCGRAGRGAADGGSAGWDTGEGAQPAVVVLQTAGGAS